MFVINRVEQGVLHHVGAVLRLEHEHAIAGQECGDSIDEVADRFDVRDDVVGDNQRGPAVLGGEPRGQCARKELRHGRNSRSGCEFGDVARRIDAENTHFPFAKRA